MRCAAPSAIAEVFADYRKSGLSLKGHPISLLRPQLDQLRVTRSGNLEKLHDGRHLRVAGLVLLRQLRVHSRDFH